MTRTRYAASTFGPVVVLAAVTAVQAFITSPGTVTDVELRTVLLVAIPAFTVLFTARWVDRGAQPFDPDR